MDSPDKSISERDTNKRYMTNKKKDAEDTEPPHDAGLTIALTRLHDLVELYPTEIPELSDKWDMSEREVQEYLRSGMEEDLHSLVSGYTGYLLPDTEPDEPRRAESEKDSLKRLSPPQIAELDTPSGRGEYLEIEVVGYGHSYIESPDGDYATFAREAEGDEECTIISTYISNNTSTTWGLSSDEFCVVSTDGFSHDDPWFLLSQENISPWKNGAYTDIKPNSKAKVIFVYSTVFEPARIEYDIDLLHTELNTSSGREKFTVEIDDSDREKIRSLPESLPIDSEFIID
jgi:hypothetical protein